MCLVEIVAFKDTGHKCIDKAAKATNGKQNESDMSSVTALLTAANNDHNAIVALLLNRGAHLNVDRGLSPLQAAAYHGHHAVVQLLLNHEPLADVNYQGGHYGNALQAAIISGNLDVFKAILEGTKDVNARG
jgi:ankyrin repeat protein